MLFYKSCFSCLVLFSSSWLCLSRLCPLTSLTLGLRKVMTLNLWLLSRLLMTKRTYQSCWPGLYLTKKMANYWTFLLTVILITLIALVGLESHRQQTQETGHRVNMVLMLELLSRGQSVRLLRRFSFYFVVFTHQCLFGYVPPDDVKIC